MRNHASLLDQSFNVWTHCAYGGILHKHRITTENGAQQGNVIGTYCTNICNIIVHVACTLPRPL